MRLSRDTGVAPWAAGFLAGLLTLLVALVILNCGCLSADWQTPNSVPVPSLAGQRTRAEQAQHAVQIILICIDTDDMYVSGAYGSGVMVGGNRVATASHVVKCSYTPLIMVVNWKLDVAVGSVTKFNKYADLAVLTVEAKDNFYPRGTPPEQVSVGPRPFLGERVCSEVRHPKVARQCGIVTHLDHVPRLFADTQGHLLWESDVVYDGFVEHGNSGAGAYDAAGNLIGVVTELLPRKKTGGRLTSLDGHRNMLR